MANHDSLYYFHHKSNNSPVHRVGVNQSNSGRKNTSTPPLIILFLYKERSEVQSLIRQVTSTSYYLISPSPNSLFKAGSIFSRETKAYKLSYE